MAGTGGRAQTRGRGLLQRIPGDREGRIAGYVLKVSRTATGLTQDQFAERLGVDLTTVQGWESGRRPLMAVSTATYLRIRHAFVRLGIDPVLLKQLEAALEADRFVGYALGSAGPVDIHEHPLATWVITRPFTDLVGWALSGKPPGVLAPLVGRRGRGPTPDGPHLADDERRHTIAHLRTAAEQAAPDTTAGALLLRQAHYIAGFDSTADTVEWLALIQRQAQQRFRPGEWSPSWAVVRSGAHTLARQGDPDALPHFIKTRTATEDCEAANLNYWSYWIGELSDPQLSDEFMIRTNVESWRGDRLLDHLVMRLEATNPYVDVVAHTVWSLTCRKPDAVTLKCADALVAAVQRLFDEGSISEQSQRELEQVLYALRTIRRR